MDGAGGLYKCIAQFCPGCRAADIQLFIACVLVACTTAGYMLSLTSHTCTGCIFLDLDFASFLQFKHIVVET